MVKESLLEADSRTSQREPYLYRKFLESYVTYKIYPSAYQLRKWAWSAGYTLGGGQAELLRERFIERILEEVPQTPQVEVPLWDEYPYLQPPVLIISDLHIPYHRSDWLDRVLFEAKERGIGQILIAGDIIDSKRVAFWTSEDGLKLDQELEIARELISEMKRHFLVEAILGNHDDRLAKLVGRELRTEQLLSRWLDITVHRYHQAYVGESWIISHPQNYSKAPAQPALALATKYEKNVAVAHTHQFSLARTLSGKWWAIEIGTCMDPRYVEYLHRNMSTHPMLQNGALIIDEAEKPLLLHPDMSF